MKIRITLEGEFFDGKVINVRLFENEAPITVNNFINLVRDGVYNGTIFHRVIDNFMIQTGGYYITNSRLDAISKHHDIKPIKGEFKSNGVENNILHKKGTISMARTSDKNSATSQFFLCSVDTPHLDNEYAAFGRCEDDTIKVIEEISKVQTIAITPGLTDFPYDVVGIKTIEVVE